MYNPTGTFDNDQYLLEIVVPAGDTTIFDALSAWVTSCASDCLIESFGDVTECGKPTPDVPLPPVGK